MDDVEKSSREFDKPMRSSHASRQLNSALTGIDELNVLSESGDSGYLGELFT